MDRTGEVRYLSISGEPIFDDRNQFKGYRGITRDITERRQAEALMQEPHRFQPAILDALEAPIAVLDQAGAVLTANQAWRTLATTHSGVGTGVAVGYNYLAVCDDACGKEQVDGRAIAAGIRQVIAGERALFRYDYGCDSPADGPGSRSASRASLEMAARAPLFPARTLPSVSAESCCCGSSSPWHVVLPTRAPQLPRCNR